jgi:hypothetical protein
VQRIRDKVYFRSGAALGRTEADAGLGRKPQRKSLGQQITCSPRVFISPSCVASPSRWESEGQVELDRQRADPELSDDANASAAMVLPSEAPLSADADSVLPVIQPV